MTIYDFAAQNRLLTFGIVVVVCITIAEVANAISRAIEKTRKE